MFRRIAVIGLGLVGGSVALATKRARPEIEIVGHDPDPAAGPLGRERGAIDRHEADLSKAVAGADLVLLAAPVDLIPEICAALGGAVEADAIVTDVGSAKRAVVTAGEAAFGPAFIGGHPMAGSERHGMGAADDELFTDALWVLTPTELTASNTYQRAAELAALVGARAIAVDTDAHDALIARLSHVPQLAASALVDVAAAAGDRDALLGLAGGGFRDATRIAASNPDLWVAILRSNRAAVLAGLDTLITRLRDTASLIDNERWDELAAWLAAARAARLELFAKPLYTGEPVTLGMLIPDRPGVLAEVTTAAGRIGANIEDLRILHSTEGGRGRLELVIGGRPAATALAAALTRLGYHVDTAEA